MWSKTIFFFFFLADADVASGIFRNVFVEFIFESPVKNDIWRFLIFDDFESVGAYFESVGGSCCAKTLELN